MNVFDPQPIEYQVGDFKLVLSPLPFLRLQKALAVVTTAFKDLDEKRKGSANDMLATLPGVLAERFGELASILFTQEFVTPEWIATHMTLPLARRILRDALVQNEVADFFADLRGRPTPEKAPEPIAAER